LRHLLSLHRIGLHAVRSAFHFSGQYLLALAITLLPLATVFALEFTAPVWLALLAVPMLGERMTVNRAASILLGFLGVVVVLRPGLESFRPAALIVLAASFLLAFVYITTKQLTAKDNNFSILFWMNVMQLPMGLAGSDPLFPLQLGPADLPAVIGFAIAGTASHYCLSQALRYGDALLVVPIDFLRIPLIALVGWALYAETPDLFVFAGAALIVLGVLVNLRAETR
jgi:drug/metabolite transporter (DMT)-like permease